MSYSSIIFDKELYQLEYPDLESFFTTQKQENLNLEFKSYVDQGEYQKKLDAIKKSACALLNSEGGIIIWGAPVEMRDKDGNTSAKGQLTPFSSSLDRDRLVNILTSAITPMPVGIKVQPLKNSEGKSIFVIEVDKSVERPHQFDNLYYVRLDGQTRIAPHYLISALIKSTNFPNLKGHIRLKAINRKGQQITFTFRSLILNASPFTNEINVRTTIITLSGSIQVNGIDSGKMFKDSYPILSNGNPYLLDFNLVVSAEELHKDIDILFQFGGEKSPAKISKYKYRVTGSFTIGRISDENKYLVDKTENKLPFEINDNPTEKNIQMLLDS